MEPSFWHERWQRSEIGFHEGNANANLVQFWSSLSLQPDERVLVPLCGKSLDMLWLAGEGFKVMGIELSEVACAAFFGENGLTPRRFREGAFEVWDADEIRILQGNIFDLQREQVADIRGVYDRAALIALPPEMRARYVRHLAAILPDAARTLLVTIEFDQAKRPGPPFSVGEADVRQLYEPAFEVELLHTGNLSGSNSSVERKPARDERVFRITRKAAL